MAGGQGDTSSNGYQDPNQQQPQLLWGPTNSQSPPAQQAQANGFPPTSQGIYGVQNPGLGAGAENATPFTNAGFYQQFQDPNAQRNLNAIQGMQGKQLQGYGPGGSSLAGLTTLAPVANAQTAHIDTGQSQNLMGGQIQNINALNAQAQGQGPSVAAETARQQAEANTKANMAVLGSQRGAANSALGIRAAQDMAAQQQQGAAQNATMGRAQEAMGARAQLTGALGGATQQAQQGSQAQAQLSQQAGMQNAQAANQMTAQQGQLNQQTQLANLQAQLAAGQLNASQYNAQVQALMAQNNNDFGAQMTAAQQLMQYNIQKQGLDAGQAINSTNNNYGMASAGIAGGAALGAGALDAIGRTASDERLKTGVQGATRGIKDFLSQIGGGARPGIAFALMGERP